MTLYAKKKIKANVEDRPLIKSIILPIQNLKFLNLARGISYQYIAICEYSIFNPVYFGTFTRKDY